ncbi:MAG: DUF5702 domain-containing protein, partial [Lachnospiraceae bacterium]|nr:DUF5702 domain-containing protein [Lachnospiraceae bacterium]
SLSLTIILSLIGALIESARYSALRMRTEMIMQMGLMSIFAEYNRELLKDYDLLFIDTTYGTGKADISATEDHLKNYIQYNGRPSKGILSYGLDEVMALDVEKADLTLYSYASDQGGREFKRQAIHAVKNRYGMGIVEKLKKNSADYEKSGVKDYDVDSKRHAVEERLKGVDLGVEKCPVEEVYDERPGIVETLVTGGKEVSDKKLLLNNTASHRNLRQGAGVVRPDSDPDSFTNELLFDAYLKWKMSSYINDLSHGSCSYELEYILNGKNTDQANLRDTVFKLFMIREASDTMAVFNDEGKRSQCEALAAVISLLLLNPEIEEPLTDMLLFTWGFAESVIDMKTLLNGGKIPPIKDGKDFRIKTVAELPIFLTLPAGNRENTSGIDYGDYCLILLAAENKTKKAMRAMDVIEMNMRTKEGNKGFRMDGCIDYAEADVSLRAPKGYSFTIRRDYSYEAVIE